MRNQDWPAACTYGGVRIALAAMTNGTTNPLLTNTQSTIAASFLSVLSTVGSPVQGVAAKDSRSNEQNGSDAANSQQDAAKDIPQTNLQRGIPLASPFADVTGKNLTILPVARFHSVLSTTSAAVASTAFAPRNQKDNTEPAAAEKDGGGTVAVPVGPIPVDVVTMPVAETATPDVPVSSGTAQSVVGAGVAPSEQPAKQTEASATENQPSADVTAPTPMMVAADAVDSVPGPSTRSTENAAGATAAPQTSTAAKSEATTDQASTQTTPPSSATGASLVDSASLRPTPPANDPQVKNPQQTTASPAPAVAELTTDKQLPTSASHDTAVNSNVPTASTTPAITAHSIDQHSVPFVFAQSMAQILKTAAPLGTTLEPNKTADKATQTSAADTVNAGHLWESGPAQNSTVKAAMFGGSVFPAVKVLPDLSFGNATGTAAGAIGKGSAGNLSDAVNGKDVIPGGSSAAKNNSSQNGPTEGSTASSAQNNGTSQHAQPDASQINAVTAKAADGSTLQTLPIQAAAPSPIASGTTERAPHSAEMPATVAPPSDGMEVTGTSGINTAKLIQTLSETQMHVGMRSAEFGDISIRTAVSQQQMVAQITVDHGDLGRAIAQHASAAQTKLGDDLGVRAAIQVTHSGMSFSQEQGNAPQQEQRPFARSAEVVGAVNLAETESTAPRAVVAPVDADRLDIRA